MNKNLKVWIVILITLIAVALLAGLWAALTFYNPQSPWMPIPRPGIIMGDIEFFYIAKTVVSTLNIALLSFLILTYADIYRKTRSQFTIGLLIFSIVFLMKDFAANPMVIRAAGFHLFGLGPFALLPDLLEFVALTVLLYLCSE
ncbi:MAG: hypothetical protein QXU99_06780 [Candidatus Bathyarchaeia archaeon]